MTDATDRGVIEVEKIEPIVTRMATIIFSPRILSHAERRDMENLVSLLQLQLKKAKDR